jgi:hypothetical protein
MPEILDIRRWPWLCRLTDLSLKRLDDDHPICFEMYAAANGLIGASPMAPFLGRWRSAMAGERSCRMTKQPGDPCPGDATTSAKVREMLFATPHEPAVASSVLAYASCGKVGADDHAEATLRSFAILWVPRVGAVLFVVRSIADGSAEVYSMSLGEVGLTRANSGRNGSAAVYDLRGTVHIPARTFASYFWVKDW